MEREVRVNGRYETIGPCVIISAERGSTHPGRRVGGTPKKAQRVRVVYAPGLGLKIANVYDAVFKPSP